MSWLLKNISTGVTAPVPTEPTWNGQFWIAEGVHVADIDGTHYSAIAIADNYPDISVPQFLQLFTSAERVAIRARVAVADAPVLDDWWAILEDPRTIQVDLNGPGCEQALDYLVSISLLTSDRIPHILAGELQ